MMGLSSRCTRISDGALITSSRMPEIARSCGSCSCSMPASARSIAWSAVANAGISGEMVRDLMVAAVERRFKRTCTPHPVEWLSDNGSAYIAKDTADIARALGLTLLFTPIRSPESNGISESFFKTLKRDYARLNILHDADAILAMLPDWIEDYCEVHPHSGLKFRSPREFIRLSA